MKSDDSKEMVKVVNDDFLKRVAHLSESMNDLAIELARNRTETIGLNSRFDRHGKATEIAFEKIWEELKDQRKAQDFFYKEMEKRVSKIESEKALMIKVVTPIIGIFSGAISGFITRHINP